MKMAGGALITCFFLVHYGYSTRDDCCHFCSIYDDDFLAVLKKYLKSMRLGEGSKGVS